MAVTDQQKLDFLLKKIGYTKTKTGSVVGTGAISGTPKQPFAEAIPSPLIIANGALWNEADSIPATPPGADTTQVKVYLAATSGLRMTADATSSGQRAYIAYSTYGNTSSTRLTNWIDTQFGASYIIKVFKGDPNSGGVNLSAAGSGANDGWFFDYSAGVLNFNDTNVPSGVTDNNIYIVGYRYIGQTGAPTSGISTFSFKDLTVERNLDVGAQGGISTFRNNIDLNADLDVDGHTNLDNVNIAGVTTHQGLFKLPDSTNNQTGRLMLGTGSDLQIFHTGSAGEIGNFTGNLNIKSNSFRVFNGGASQLYIKADQNDSVVLYHSNNEKFRTTNTGAVVTGILTVTQDLDVDGHTNLDNVSIAGFTTITQDLDVDGHTNLDNVSIAGITTFHSNVHLLDNDKLQFGDSQDFSIYHDGSHTYIEDSGTGGLVAKTSQFVVKDAAGSQNLFVANPSGPVSLFYNNVNRLSTSATGVSITGNNVISGNVSAVDATFTGNVSIGGTLTYEDVQNVDAVGLITARSGIRVTGGVIEAQAGENKIPSLYAAMGNLPSAGSYHGMFAHVHATGRGYFAHAGNWLELVNKEINGVVGTGTERYNIGPVDLTTLDVSGISTFAGNVDINADIDVDGHTNLDNVNIAGVTTIGSYLKLRSFATGGSPQFTAAELRVLKIDGSTGGPMIQLMQNGADREEIQFFTTLFAAEFQKDGRLLLNKNFQVTGVSTFTGAIDANGDLDVDGHTNLDNVSVAGVSTFAGAIDLNADLDVDGHTNLDNVSIAGVTTMSGNLRIESSYPRLYLTDTNHNSDFSIINNDGNFLIYDDTNTTDRFSILANGTVRSHGNFDALGGIDVTGDANVSGDLDVDGHTNLDNISVAGVSTFAGAIDLNADLDVDGHTNLDNVSIVGVTTHQGHVLPSADATYDLGSSSKQWRNFYVSNIVSAPGFGIIGPDLTVRNFTATGISTHVGIATFNNATFHRDIDVDGHTNLDNVSIAGVTTTTGDINIDADNKKLQIGDGQDLQLVHTGTYSNIYNATGDLDISSNVIRLKNGNRSETYAAFINGGQAEFYYDNSRKITTTTTGINVTGLTDTDTLLSSGNATFSGTITAGGVTGNNGQYLKSTGSGVAWESFPTLRTRNTFTASAGQTTFSFSYTVNFLDVFVNGIKLTDAEFTATNGSSVVLAVGCFVGDIVELVSYNTVSGGGGGGGSLNNIVEDTTPQLGGNLDLFNKSITGTGNVNITGIITATNFVGDGSGLTGITASGSGVVVKNSGSTVGTAGTINFGDNLSVSPASAGIVTITATNTQLTTEEVQDIVGAMFSGNTETNITATYQDSDGTIDLIASGGSATTINNNADNRLITGSGTANTLEAESGLTFDGSTLLNAGSGFKGITIAPNTNNSATLRLQNSARNFSISNITGGTFSIADGSDARLTINSSGTVGINNDLDVDGHTELDNVNIAGVVTATTFKGALQGTSGTFSSGVDITGDLDVDGHTDLDNVSIAGVVTATTFVGALTGNVTGNVSGSSGSCTGNSATATEATNVTVTANNSTNETVYPVFVDGATGTQGAETDTGLNYNPSTGNLSATKFTGDGSGLTGITASGSGVVIKHDGSTVGTAGTINFSTNLDVSAISAGIVTVTASGGSSGVTTDSSGNTFAGANSGLNLASGANDNTFYGRNSGRSVTTGDENTAIGDGALKNNQTGNQNIALGHGAMESFTSNFSVGIGHDVASKAQSGTFIAIGRNAGFNATSNSSILIGMQVASAASSLNNCVIIGAYAAYPGNVGSGCIVIGNSAQPSSTSATNEITLGDANITKFRVPGIGVTFKDNGGTPTQGHVLTVDANGEASFAAASSSPDVGITTNLSGTFTASAGSPTTLNSFGYGSGDTVFEYTIYIKNGSDFQTQKLLAMRDGTTVHSTQFAVMFSSSLLVQCDATISSGNILLRATPETGVSGSTTFKVKREVM